MAPSVHVMQLSYIDIALNTTCIMYSQLSNRGRMASRNASSINQHPAFSNKILNGTVIKLLVAPTVDDKAMWKAQAFDFVRDKSRGKNSAKISADNVIAVIGEHFPVSTMLAE